MVSKRWDEGEVSQFTFGSSWTGSTLQASSTKQLLNINIGDTIVRTRMQGQVLIGVSSVSNSATGSYTEVLTSTRIMFGLYMNKASDTLPGGIPAHPYDGNWLQHNQLSCKQVFETGDLGGSTRQMALFGFDGGTSESFAKRGPATTSTHLVMAWSFVNSIQPYWALNTTQDLGIMSAFVTCHALIEGP